MVETQVAFSLRYFDTFLPLVDSFLCCIQDDVSSMGYLCKWLLGSVTSSSMADIFLYFFFLFHFLFPENLKFYTENTFSNTLACQRSSNTSSCFFTTTWPYNTSLNISYRYMYTPIFSKITIKVSLRQTSSY